jgi:transposase
MTRPFGTAAELEQRRRQAVDAVHRGESPSVVARLFGVRRSSLYRWRRMALAGTNALHAKPSGPKFRLSDEQLDELERLLLQGAKAHGWPNELWTTARVAQLIRRHFGVSYHHDHVGRFLRQRLGWTPQKPGRRARERDEEGIQRWKREEFPRIVQETFARGAHLIFLDESGFFLNPSVRRTWSPSGQTPVLDAWDRRDRLSAISTLSVSSVNHRLGLQFRLLTKNAKADDVVAYLRELKHCLGTTKLTILWDGSRIHDRAGAVKSYLAQHHEIVTERLPAYAPELNPDELVWSWTKYGRLSNLAAMNKDSLAEAVIDELVYLHQHPDLLASFIQKTDLPLRI